MMIRGSKELIRNINCTNVLEKIINSEPISRAYLAKKLGLTKATISSIVQELLNQKLVLEIGSDETKFGRKPILLSFNKKAGYAISIDIGDKIISASLTDLKGESAQYKRIQTPQEPSELLNCLTELIQSMQQLTNASIYGVVGITIGVHEVVHHNKVSDITSNTALSNIDLINELEEIFHIPVFIENEANLSAIGEYSYKSSFDNIANLNIHNTIELGMIMHNKLYTGNHGFAGAIGHTIVVPEGRPCECGNHGCLEQYLSLPSLVRDYSEKIHVPTATLNDLLQAYEEKQPAAVEVMAQFVEYATICVNNIIHFYSPDYLIINCELFAHFPSLLNRIKDKLTCEETMPKQIVSSALENSVLYGGICIAVKEFLHINQFMQIEQTETYVN